MYLLKNSKKNFVFYFSMNFMFLKNEIKVCLKICKKNIFVIRSLYVMVCKMNDPVKILMDFKFYLVVNFILYIKFVHFV
jgi:hypothetical protein